MTHAEVEPYIRRWVEVTLVGETVPRFRGHLLWAGGVIAVFINGPPPGAGGDAGRPLPPKYSIPISKISDITVLSDPPWLPEINKAAAVASAEELIDRLRRRL